MKQLAFGVLYDGGVDAKGRLIVYKKYHMDSAQSLPDDNLRKEVKVLESDTKMA